MQLNQQPPSLSQQAYEQIRYQIITLALRPNSVIDEHALQDELSLGRTPIREALKRLELEGLVTIVPRRGMFVTEVSLLDLHRLYEVRLNLECLAAELAAQRGTANHWIEMGNALAEAKSDSNADERMRIDERCHLIMYDAADNHFLTSTLTSLYTLSLRMWYFALDKLADKPAAVVEPKHLADHGRMLTAFRSGDTQTAVSLMRDHVNQYQTDIQSYLVGTKTHS